MRRLFIELVIIGAIIFSGWNKPFREWTAEAYNKITAALDTMGGSLQKNQDSSVRRY